MKKPTKYYVVIGDKSVGKTSLLNTIFHMSNPLHQEDKTIIKGAKFIIEHGTLLKCSVWECPGFNEEKMDLFNIKIISLLAVASKVFLLFDVSLQPIWDIARVLLTVRSKNLYLVRTKCDLIRD